MLEVHPQCPGHAYVRAVQLFARHEYSEVESAQLGDSLARFLHVCGDLGQRPWAWERGQTMQQFGGQVCEANWEGFSLRAKVNCWSYRALAFLRMGAGGFMHGLDGGLILVDHGS